MFKNQPVQGTGADVSAGYHGYWITDFTQIDPHFGTNAELTALIAGGPRHGHQGLLRHHHQPHRRRDPVRRRTSTPTAARPTTPTSTPTGNAFDDRDFAGTADVPDAGRRVSFPYTPGRRRRRTTDVKAPAWLNDPTLLPQPRQLDLHRRELASTATSSAWTTCSPSSPAVVDGHDRHLQDVDQRTAASTASASTPSSTSTIEFWQEFAPGHPGLRRRRTASRTSSSSARSSTRNPAFTSPLHHRAASCRRSLDFRFQAAAPQLRRQGGADRRPARPVRRRTTTTPTPTPTPTACPPSSATTTWAASATSSRPTTRRRRRRAAGPRPARAHADVLRPRHAGRLLRRRAGLHRRRRRQGRPPGHVPQPGRLVQRRRPDRHRRAPPPTTTSTQTHPLYQHLAGAGRRSREAHPALRTAPQMHRYADRRRRASTPSPASTAAEGVEYVVALNNADDRADRGDPDLLGAACGFTGRLAGRRRPAADHRRPTAQLAVTVPPLSAVVYRADAALVGRRRRRRAITVDRPPARRVRRSTGRGRRSRPTWPQPASPR